MIDESPFFGGNRYGFVHARSRKEEVRYKGCQGRHENVVMMQSGFHCMLIHQ